MFVLAGAAASVLDHLGSLALSGALRASAGKAGQAFQVGASTTQPAAGNGGAAGNWSTSETMGALLSLQGQAGKTEATGSAAASLLGSMFQHAQFSTASGAGRTLSTFV
jgi:hypothetical protein